MHLRVISRLFLAAILGAATTPAFPQVSPAAGAGGLPLAIGAGPSSWDVDWGHGRMLGGTLWIDYSPRSIPSILRGIGIEAEARDISIGAGITQRNVRQDTAGGGVIYTWRHFPGFYPYAKGLIAFGSYDFKVREPYYTHDTRNLYAPGVGLECRVIGHIWARADYEYQFWQILMGHRPDPQGFTFGAMYDFRPLHRR